MKKIAKYVGLVILALVLVAGIGAAWLYQAGQDDSPPPLTKAPPPSSKTSSNAACSTIRSLFGAVNLAGPSIARAH